MSERALALVGGRLFGDSEKGADSVLVEDGRIARVGSEAEVRRGAGNAPVVELNGRTLSPGFHDAHFHFLQTGIERARPSLQACGRIDDVFDAVRDEVARPATGPLRILEAWDESAWPVARWPLRAELDAMARDVPVLLRRVDGHSGVVNGAAIELFSRHGSDAGIDRETGAVIEGPLRNLEQLFPPTAEDLKQAFSTATELCLSLGVTTTSDFLQPQPAQFYAMFLAREPRIRVNAYRIVAARGEADTFPELSSSESFRWRGIKIFGDGSIGGRNAALFEPYADRTGEAGVLLLRDESLRELIRDAHDRGWSAAVHAIGDRAIAQALDAFSTLPADENRANRHRIEHFEIPRPRDVDRLGAIGVRPCVQPNFVGRWAGPGGLYETALGPRRLAAMNPFRSLLARGTGLFFGSDGMPPSPRFGIWSALTHPVETERLDLTDAHASYTSAAADAVRGDRRSGRITVGADADLVVLPGSLPEWVHGTRESVDLTIVDGRIRYAHPSG